MNNENYCNLLHQKVAENMSSVEVRELFENINCLRRSLNEEMQRFFAINVAKMADMILAIERDPKKLTSSEIK